MSRSFVCTLYEQTLKYFISFNSALAAIMALWAFRPDSSLGITPFARTVGISLFVSSGLNMS
jgi:hypothetical protein